MKILSRTTVLQRCVLATAFAVAASFSDLAHSAPLAIGAIEQFDTRTSSIVVMGQKYSVGSVKLIAGSKSYSAIQGARLLTPGALVWVDGEFQRDGSTKVASLTVLPELNVPGATQVFVAGVVRSVDHTGRVKVGSLTIDTSPTIGSSNAAIKVGDTIEFLGTQPVTGGVLVASAVAPQRAQGTGVNGVGGTGVNGVGGTGVNGVGGTGVNGVGGTGVNGVGGTGVNGVGGTGVNGVGGTGVKGVGGTGR